MKLDILAIGAHPDDVELGCSATIAKEIASGKKVGILDLTRGELGTRGSAEIRDEEAKEAAKVLDLSMRENLGFADGFFEDDNKEHQLEIIKILRKYRPDIVLLNPPYDRHIDHGKGSKLASSSCFLSGLRRIETELEGVQQEAWRPKQVYHYIQWQPMEPDFVVDVTGFIDKKIEAVKAYKSQFFDPNSKEPSSPISSKNFLESIKYRAQDLGRLVNVDYAEGFTTERYIAVKNLSDIF
ncbi:bacillithiol biosynthesis deacetylase BshB1 [Aureivirga marina]|uniref:bacillithiol biosynthesis deacetylase BshB1 n=1 Tax=Aureivirga marina TaxID=1182451 RepID=UPI0018C9C9D2|nr:bacillithiol biosynthesis deacetylase BshB1 [Aureivirga marina]